jgi:putative DNA primase/helicase
MNTNILNNQSSLQEDVLIKNTLERIEKIDSIIDKNNLPDGFEVDEVGVWFLHKKNNCIEREWLCSPLLVTAYTRDHKNENHGRILEFQDIDGYKHQWTMSMDLLAGDGSKILASLFNMGLIIAPKKKIKDRLLEYISQCTPIRRARCVLQCGWFNNSFVLPSQIIGYIQSEKIIYQNASTVEARTDISGTLVDWQEKVSKMAIGNSRLILAMSASFAGPLLNLMNHENIGIHFRGPTSLGKSTAEYVANSVWGDEAGIYTFRATSNGLEGIASLHNDRLLCLDELGQISPHEAGQVIYMLGNGVGKARANQYGLAKKQVTWRLVFLSTGELSLSQLLNEAGKKVKGGQEVRFIEVVADTGIYGLFENLHGFEGGDVFSKYLKNTCSNFYGVASKVFLGKVVEDIEGTIEMVKAIINGISQRYLPINCSGQVIRVFNHLALIAAAGELASKWGITSWGVEEAITGVMKCFEGWVETRGGLGMHEERNAITQVRKFFELHGESRFSSWDNDPIEEGRTINRAGFRRRSDEGDVEFYVFTNAFREEICSGLDYHYVEKLCIKNNLVLPGSDNSPTRSERLPDSKKTKRCYRFTSAVLSE